MWSASWLKRATSQWPSFALPSSSPWQSSSRRRLRGKREEQRSVIGFRAIHSLFHQLGDLDSLRIAGGEQAVGGAQHVLSRAILAQLPFALDARNLNLEA